VNHGVAILSFPGSNGDRDAVDALAESVGVPTRLVDYREESLDGFEAVVLPGGFSYGDYLRTGAIARFAPVMTAVQQFALTGGPVLGICNGFQILTEAHLLPGAILPNRDLRFHSEWVHIRVETGETAWSSAAADGEVLTLPVAHGLGNYFADPETLATLEHENRVVFRYCDAGGHLTEQANINGSMHAIAGICNQNRNVVGLMPHPERAADPLLGAPDGLRILNSVTSFVGPMVRNGR